MSFLLVGSRERLEDQHSATWSFMCSWSRGLMFAGVCPQNSDHSNMHAPITAEPTGPREGGQGEVGDHSATYWSHEQLCDWEPQSGTSLFFNKELI